MKYYYDCPIKAAYMSKEFGVQFATKGSYDVEANFVYDLSQSKIVNAHVHVRFYVHPLSLHIFEPQVGDVVYQIEHNTGARIEDETAYIWKGAFNIDRMLHGKIVMRNSKAFIWPESEE